MESGAVGGRIGTELRLSLPITTIWHVLLAADAHPTPASLGNADRRLDPLLPPLPAYAVGLTAGIEVAVP